MRLDEQDSCALCGMLLPRTGTPTVLSVRNPAGLGFSEVERVYVCENSSACRRRAIEIVRAYEKMKL